MRGPRKGFTLIELLVVVAIIGLLASTVLASLSSARANARDSQLKTAMLALASQAELYRLQRSDYVALRIWWVGIYHDGTTNTCATRNIGSISPYGAEFLAICEDIEKLLLAKNNYFTYWAYRERVGNVAWTNSHWRGDKYAFMVRLSNGDWFCVNSDGVRQQGPTAEIGCRDVTL